MSILILVDPADAEPFPVTARLVGAASRIDDQITLFVTGKHGADRAAALAGLEGIGEVIWSLHPDEAQGVPPEDLTQGVVEQAHDYTHILASATSFGAERIPRIAACLGLSPLSSVVEIRDAATFVRPVHAGALLSLVRVRSSPVLLTIQPWAFAPVALGQQQVRVRRGADLPRLGLSISSGWHPEAQAGSEDLATARVVVAGGGGLEKGRDFSPVEALARALGGAVGASRGAVDAGLASPTVQIGQTGRIIAPELYVALGISGAVQHLAGIKEAGCVVSINLDPQAPMSTVADLSCIGDLYQLVPEWIAALKAPSPPTAS